MLPSLLTRDIQDGLDEGDLPPTGPAVSALALWRELFPQLHAEVVVKSPKGLAEAVVRQFRAGLGRYRPSLCAI